MKKSILLFVACFCLAEAVLAEQMTIEDMFHSADLVLRVNASSLSYRVDDDRCVLHHWGKVKKVYKGDNIKKGQVLDLGHTTYYSHYILDEYIVFIKGNMLQEDEVNLGSFEGVNLYESDYTEDCLKSIRNSYRQIWGDPKGALRVTDRYNNGVVYYVQLPESVLLPNHIKRIQPVWNSSDIKEGWYWVEEKELNAYLKSLRTEKLQ